MIKGDGMCRAGAGLPGSRQAAENTPDNVEDPHKEHPDSNKDGIDQDD
jgi:hypothetical protein